MRILVLTPHAFGGHGGIAQYSRDLITALNSMPDVKEIVAVPRFACLPAKDLPAKLLYRIEGINGGVRYIRTVITTLGTSFDLVICAHINLLPLAWLVSVTSGAPLVLLVYGIDVWKPHKSPLTRLLLSRVQEVWSISEITRDKMATWSKLPIHRFHILSNAIALERYGTGRKEPALTERYGLTGHKVIMILARLASNERYKGVDEVLELLPELLKSEPSLIFLVAGDGDDRPRLEEKAKTLGVSDHVVFAGYVYESEKVAHLRLADAFVMAGRGEGFGFVYLEAMACGVPVVASTLDGSREAVRFGQLGHVVDPDDRQALAAAIMQSLNSEKKVPEGLGHFSFTNFQSRVQSRVIDVVAK